MRTDEMVNTNKPFDPGARHRGPVRREGGVDYVVGIDTGGTYTDGVLLDYRSRRVLTSGKTLTTRDDLSRGVIKVLKMLDIKDPARIRLVGISSTLATNSIAEGKAREVGLILIGYDPDLIEKFGLRNRFTTPYYAIFQGGHTSQGAEKTPLDLDGIRGWVEEYKDRVDAFAVSGYFSPLNPSHEEAVFAEIRRMGDHPVVMGHQLSTQLDSVKRAATASLNASLVAVMQEFIHAVGDALKSQNINAPLMIVKGDGSLMSYMEASEKPVETVLSGPAASAIGGQFFSSHANALMIDVGGTTTDMAFIEEGRVAVTDTGARVGEIETAVRAARIRTACVGCDSRIAFARGGRTTVGPDRVVPLCRLAHWFPQVARSMEALFRHDPQRWTLADIRYWFLHKPADVDIRAGMAPRHTRLLSLLNEGPKSVSRLVREAGVNHEVQLEADTLLRQGIIEEATLAPTDLLHVTGQMDLWDVQTARRAVECACAVNGKDKKTFVAQTLDLIVSMMVEEAVIFLARQADNSGLPETIGGRWARWLLDEAVIRQDPHLSVQISCRYPIIGIGAPAEYFVKRVAELLQAPFVLPRHAGVANAAGAVAGSVVTEQEAIVYIQESEEQHCHIVQIGEDRKAFNEYDEAMAYARKIAGRRALEKAESAGAAGPQVTIAVKTEGAIERVRARAVGNPRLSEQWG